MASISAKAMRYMRFSPFKRAMNGLSKNRGMTIQGAEKAIDLEADFTEQIDRGIRELSLEDVIKIAIFFGTTMDSVLDEGRREIRVVNNSTDVLAFQYFKECVETYAQLLEAKGLNYHTTNLYLERIKEYKAELEERELLYMERYKTYMEQFERENFQGGTIMEIGHRIKQLRIEKGYTQKQLSDKIGLTPQMISFYENGERTPPIDILLKLVHIFSVSSDYLLGRTNKRHPDEEYEWRYPPVSNRLGIILSNYRERENISEKDFSEKLNIPLETYIGIQVMDAAGCCDEVLINELVKRGYKIERCVQDGTKANKGGR